MITGQDYGTMTVDEAVGGSELNVSVSFSSSS